MPLHLLGKKSWNVYNYDNIERVKRDEAEAQAEAVEQERLTQNAESDQRLAQLRGHVAEPQSSVSTPSATSSSRANHRRTGDDDRGTHGAISKCEKPIRSNDAPFGDRSIRNSSHERADQKGSETRSAKHVEQQGMRLADAAGYGTQIGQPWYSAAPGQGKYQSSGTGRDVWGNEDPRRQDREQQRMMSSDPLAAMKKGVKQLRKAESDRNEWKAQRERDLNEVEELARKERKHRRHRRGRNSSMDSLEDFDLDGDYRKRSGDERQDSHERHHRHRHHHRQRHGRHRSTSRAKARSRSPKRNHA